MIRKTLFWLHLSVGIVAGLFIFIMAATGVVLSFERQITEFIDKDVRSTSVPQDAKPRPINELLEAVRRTGRGEPAQIVTRNEPQATIQFSIGRGRTVYVDPYSGAVLGGSSADARNFFATVERLHRALGAPQGSKGAGHWLATVSNLLFGALILLGTVLWLPRKWTRKSVRGSIAFRTALRGKAREWNWHNVIGIWCAIPLLVIVLTGLVMSFDWANALLFRLSGSTLPASGRNRTDAPPRTRLSEARHEPNYDRIFTAARSLNPEWRTITLNLARDAKGPVTVAVDTGTGRQPQKRTQYLLNRDSGSVVKTSTFADGSLGQRLRAFVRFGHTGEYGGWPGQVAAAFASSGACLLVYTGWSLAIRRLASKLKRKRVGFSDDETYVESLKTL